MGGNNGTNIIYNLKRLNATETKPKKLFINQGDSGGPLICSVGSNEYLFGILSIGPTNGRMSSFLFI